MNIRILTIPLIAILFTLWNPTENKIHSDRLDLNIAQCHATIQAFADLADDPDFVGIHKDPLPAPAFQIDGKLISIPVSGGEKANAFLVKADKPSKDYLVVFHEWYGLNAYVKNETRKFSERFRGMNIIALDLYDGKTADTSDGARALMQNASTERILAIINAAQGYMGEDANIFTVGWCFGGGWSLQAAIEMGDQVNGAVMFYGMPEKDTDRLKKLETDVLAIFAEQDKWITPQVAAEFEDKMGNIDQELIIKSYDANHGFANPSNPDYNADAAADAYKVMYDFVEKRRS